MSIFQKTFVFLHHLCTSGAKSAKNSSVQEPCKIKNKKQDEDITYFTTRQNEVAPLGTAAIAHPRHHYQDDSSLGSYLHLPCLSRYRQPSFAHLVDRIEDDPGDAERYENIAHGKRKDA